ncbi:beta strand repeat-containing protein, partial [Novosphingobium sp. KN65.2]|uniref:beta strand repeat-containing protein n=1 Tax=Novosphingobium sp. KN65.2 TaxID=1478134 RepID=UPI000A72B65F
TTLTISLTDVSLVGDDESVTVYEKALDTTQTGADVAAGSITGSMPSDTGETASGAVSVTGASGYSIAGGTVNGNLTTVVGTYGTLVLNNSTGAFTYTLTSPVTTTPSANDGVTTALGAESFTYTASDANGNTTTGTISIDVVDDTPYAVVPEAIQVTNGAAPVSAPADLDADMSVIDNYGADGAGTVRFASSLDGADSGLTHNFVTITYTLVSDTVLEAYAGADKIFTVTLDPSSATYTVDMDGTIDSIQNIDFNAGGYNFVGGNNSWSGFIPVGETVGAPIDNNSQDLLLTPSINHTNDGTINSTANTGGVGGGASVGSGETFRVDFVTDLRGDPADGQGDYDTAVNRDHVFDGHYTVNGAVALFKSSSGSTVNITAFDDPDGNTVVGDGVKDTITGVSIAYQGVAYEDASGNPIIIPTSTATNYIVNGHTFTVTLLADGSVNVGGVAGASGASLSGTQIAVFTGDGFNSVEYTWAGGDTFQIGDFGASTLTNDPVNFTIPVEVVDGDGDVSAQSNLSITAVTTTPPVALDLDGDGVEFLGLDAGVTHDYGSGLVQTAWVGADDGLLAHDTGHGLDIVFTDDAAGAETDLEGLRLAYDSNGDGKLTATDAAYGEFGVWQDANSNGVVDAGEFKTLAQMGITAIDLTAEGPGSLEANGDAIVHATGEYTMKGAAYALADVSFATASVDSQTTARTAEMAAITAAAAGFMMSGAAHAMPLSPIAIEAIAAAMQTFETHLPEVTVAVPEHASATPPVSFLHDDRQVHQDSEPASHPAQHAAEQGAGHGLGEAVQHQDVATQPLGGGEQGHAQASPAPTLFGGGDSGLMQALLLAAQGKQAAGSDGQGNGQGNGHGGEHGPVDLPAVQEAIAESAGHHAVDSLIDHFAGHLGAHGAPAGGEAMGAEALDHALGTMLAGGGLEGLHAAGLAGGFEMAAMAAAMEAHSTTVA